MTGLDAKYISQGNSPARVYERDYICHLLASMRRSSDPHNCKFLYIQDNPGWVTLTLTRQEG